MAAPGKFSSISEATTGRFCRNIAVLRVHRITTNMRVYVDFVKVAG